MALGVGDTNLPYLNGPAKTNGLRDADDLPVTCRAQVIGIDLESHAGVLAGIETKIGTDTAQGFRQHHGSPPMQ